ncbi:hypothetical protein [Paraburkholderia pallida]|uniref:hypothetical protein n=1 Tax=Paraburkholderia pallida TaxID=2547399 RepID=UPI001E42BF4D|nr:hypothetical protein [Paraburkholderia pallida]
MNNGSIRSTPTRCSFMHLPEEQACPRDSAWSLSRPFAKERLNGFSCKQRGVEANHHRAAACFVFICGRGCLAAGEQKTPRNASVDVDENVAVGIG